MITNANNYYDARMLRSNIHAIFGRDSRNYKNAEKQNEIYFRNTLAIAHQIYCSRFKWSWGENEFNFQTGYIEKILFNCGYCVYYKDSQLGNLILPASPVNYNVYGEPIQFLLMGINYQKIVDADECILIKDNTVMNRPYDLLLPYVKNIADLLRTCEVYASAMKKPFFIEGEFKNSKSKSIIVEQIMKNEYYIIMDRALSKDKEPFNVMENSTHNSQDLRGLFMHRKSLFNEMYSIIGIRQNEVQKSAQVNSGELDNESTIPNLVLADSVECRKSAIEKINEISGTNLTCDLNLNPEIYGTDDLKE